MKQVNKGLLLLALLFGGCSLNAQKSKPYQAKVMTSLGDDKAIKVSKGYASSYESPDVIEHSFDGKMNTIYHSDWNNYNANYFPITLNYTFAKADQVDYLIYYPRTGSNPNGDFKVVDIYASADGKKFEKLLRKDFKGEKHSTRVDFPKAVKAKTIRLIVRSGAGDRKGFAACAEMEFYQKGKSKDDYKKLFADELCTSLKAGITQADIQQCQDPFFKNLAEYLLTGKYDKAFRVAEFKAYPHPDLTAKTHKNMPYSLRDNPTGIEVEQGEDLIAFVGDMGDYDGLSITVQNLDKPKDDGFKSAINYNLHRGVNKIKMKDKGLVYVNYHLSTLKTEGFKPIKIHFASGKVNGYYDSEKPELTEHFDELLAKAKGQYFDVVGKYAHLTFPTDSLRTYTKNGKELIGTYDKMVENEMLLLGLFKYKKLFPNRLYLNVAYNDYHMYATAYHTGYNHSTMPVVCNEKLLQTTHCWGPAHEMGHINQLRPGLCWMGMTESTNNIMSEYIQTVLFKQPSRMQVEPCVQGLLNRYFNSINEVVVKKRPFSYFYSKPYIEEIQKAYPDNEMAVPYLLDQKSFILLIPFWQLQLYFGKVLGRSPEQQADKGGFYPDVYEYIRTHEPVGMIEGDGFGNGLNQTEFVYIASKVAGYDLTDFFEKWGFLQPVDYKVFDYYYAPLKVTEKRVQEIKQRIAKLKLPKLNIPLEYITDRNADIFLNKQHIIKGKPARKKGEGLILKGWQNVVMYEIWTKPYGTEGAELKQAVEGCTYGKNGLTSGKNAIIPFFPPERKLYLYAVDINNERIEVPTP